MNKLVYLFILTLLFQSCNQENDNNKIEKLKSQAKELQIQSKELNAKASGLLMEAKELESLNSMPTDKNISDFQNIVFTLSEDTLQPIVYQISKEQNKYVGNVKLLTPNGYENNKLRITESNDYLHLDSYKNEILTSSFVGKLKAKNDEYQLLGKWQAVNDNNEIESIFNSSPKSFNNYQTLSNKDLWKELCKELNRAESKYGAYCNSLTIIYALLKPENKPFSCNKNLPISCELQEFCDKNSWNEVRNHSKKESDCCYLTVRINDAYRMYKKDPDRLELQIFENTRGLRCELYKEFESYRRNKERGKRIKEADANKDKRLSENEIDNYVDDPRRGIIIN